MASEGTTKVAQKSGHVEHTKPAKEWRLLSFASFLGFFPVAILAIMSSFKTEKFNESGDYNEAHIQSKTTKDWIIISFVNGVFVYFGMLSVIFIFVVEK